MMKKGVNMWCFPDDLSISDIFKQAKQFGYDGVELALSDQEDAEFSIYSPKEDLQRIKEMADAAGVELPSVATALHWKYSLTDENEEIRSKGIIITEKMLEAAHIFGSKTVLVVPGLVTETVSYDQAYNRALEAIKQLASKAKQLNVNIGIENVWNKFLLSPLEMARFIDEVESDYVGAYFDVGNILQYGYPEQWIHILGKRIVALHVKDFSTKVGNITGFVPLLAGDVSWKRVNQALKDIEYNGYIIPEIPPYKEYPEQLLIETSQSIDKIFHS